MHHGVGIMAIASYHMHHFVCAWNIPLLHCTTIAIIHFMGASLSWLSSIYTLSWNIFVIISWLHWHKKKCFTTSIVQLLQVINPEQGCSKNLLLNHSLCYPHLFSQTLCWISPTSVFFMWWSQHCENWPPCIIVVPRSFWRSLFGSENLTWLPYPIALKSRARIKFGRLLKSIIVIRRRP